MDNNDEILNKMIQETLDELSSNGSTLNKEGADFGEFERYFEDRSIQENASIVTTQNQIEGLAFNCFFRFVTSDRTIDFPRTFGPFINLAEGEEIQITKDNDTHSLFIVLKLVWPNKSSYKFILSKKNGITLDLNPNKSGSNVA